MMETDLTSKLPLREHVKNMRKILKLINDMDRGYFKWMGLLHILNVSMPYIELLLSAYILDGISSHKGFSEMMPIVTVTILGILLVHCLASTIYHRMEVRKEHMYNMYTCITQTKMLEMDFSRIDSPEVRELKDRIQKDNNWGAGIFSVFWQFNDALYQCANMVGALILGVPVVGYLINSGRYEALAVLAVLAVVAAVGQRYVVYFKKKSDAFMFTSLKEEDKEEQFCCCWGFADGDEFNYKNGKDIRIYGSYDLVRRWTTEVLTHKGFRKWLLNGAKGDAGQYGLSSMIYQAVTGCSYLIIAIIALGGTITVGNVIRLAGCLGSLLSGAYSLMNDLTQFALSARKQISTLELIGLENEMYDGKIPVEKRSDNQYQIEFRNVSFKYPGTENYALKNFSMKLKIGEKLAIVGMNGSGKTTMIKLLCRLYDPQEGEILLNGVDIRKFKQEEYCRLFSVVFQDYVLFPFQLGENVAVDREYSEIKVGECLTDADFGERLAGLEKGIHTYLYKDYDDSGVEISGGEAQKIAIARAMYKDAPFILLDEPTAALDPKAEYEIYTNFDRIAGSKTAVYISHRLSSCRFCEKIAVFHEGQLVQMGSHEELVADQSGKYYEMWNAQAQYYRKQGIVMEGVV